MNGTLTLNLAQIAGRTCPTHIVAVPPLQCSRARYDDPMCPKRVALTLLHLGGVLQGDQLRLDITLQSGAHAKLTTAAATQIYRMPERDAAQTTTFTLHSGARLDYLPEPIILFGGARFSQITNITLHEGATLVLREMLVAGRLARNELHQYEYYRSQFEVCDNNGRCLLSERGLLQPTNFSPATIGVQSSYPVVGSLYVLALGSDTAISLAHVWEILRNHPDVLADAGALPNGCGVLVRVLGKTTQAVRAALDALCPQHLLKR